MVTITVEKIVDAPVETVWKSWDDYANIHKFHPGLRNSYLLDENTETGLGATRQCDFTDGKTYLKERIAEYRPNERMVVDITGTNAPIKDARATFEFVPLSGTRTKVVMTMRFTPKMGLLGKLLTPIMKRQFSKGLNGLLESNAKYVMSRPQLTVAA